MIKEIYYNNFRNLKDNRIKLSNGFNLIYGKNAQGKTSFMEAVYFATTGKSFRTRKNSEMIQYDKENTIVYIKLDNLSSYSIDQYKGEKKLYENGDRVKYSEYIGTVLSVSFIPEDVELIIGDPSIRRAFFNYEISQINKGYLKNIFDYEKVLKARNKLLKEGKHEDPVFDIYNEKYIDLCVKIVKQRKWYIEELNKMIDDKYKLLFDQSNSLQLKYENFTKEDGINNLEKRIRDLLESKKKQDILKGYSSYGIHKDDFSFILNGKNAKFYSSQGEKKSIVFTLKISEIELMETLFNKKPIFLMDDISAFFDNYRKNKIINYCIEKELQCFLTSTEDIKINGKKFYVEEGVIYETK